ncbi:MAG: molecular chaperone TorD family protein [Halapricum sp.]
MSSDRITRERTSSESTDGERTSSGTTDDGRRDDTTVDARVFRVLGEQFLARPDRERVDTVGTWASEWRHTAEALPEAFESALARIEAGSDADEETLRTAYTHLFRGVNQSDPEPPYESLYVDGSFYGETTTEIRQGYRWAGVDIDDSGGNDPPDHLGLELQFLGELVAMDPDSLDEHDIEDAQRWILEHLTGWLPEYRDRLREEDPPDYYAGLLDLAVAVVEQRRDRLVARQE